jgi:ribosomal protein S21|tara:strand:+ start:6165 stop:6380 length:216 start_codon:yes stop_codon:yes gene_type:complete
MANNLTIKARRNELPDRLVRRFIKKTKKSGIIEEIKERRRFKKPSDKKREAKKRAIARQKKEMAKKAKKTN